jgi:autotransporter-associated beta strand protein
MKTLILAAIRSSLMFLVPTVTYAMSAQWDLDPISGDWNTADNWTPNSVPNGPADTATFDLSNTTDVSISANTEVNGITFTSAATNPYSIAVNAGLTLTFSGVGITNNSGVGQTLTNFGTIRFTNSATAAGVSIENGGSTNFFHSSTAGSARIRNFGSMNFFNSSSAGTAGIEGVGTTNFFNSSSAGTAGIEGDGTTNFFDRSTAGSANLIAADSSTVNFLDSSSAGSASIFTAFGVLNFFDSSTAHNSRISAFGDVNFFDSSTAGNSTINAFEFFTGDVNFFDSSSAGSAFIRVVGEHCVCFNGSSQGGTARIGLESFASLGIGAHNVKIGSLEGGDGTAFVSLGANNLTIGSNNLSTTFDGVIGGSGGSLTKIGTGTLDLTGANTYTGDTNVNRGVLQVDGSITSNTFVNRGASLAGVGTIDANLTNNSKVSPGSTGAPGALTVTGSYTQAQYATLMIQIAGASAGEFSVLNVLGTANLAGQLDPLLLNGFVPTIGESFTFLTYGSVNGTLIMLNRNIDNLPEHWEVSYFPTFATLTVEPGNVSVPDQGSTFLLLTLGLLGLVTYRRQLVCNQC